MSGDDRPVVFGAPYSVYVRAVRLALEEKGSPTTWFRSIYSRLTVHPRTI
jgi:hypothetical protein